MASDAEVEAAAAAIANARGARRGAPAVSNILEVLKGLLGGKFYREVIEDAREALDAAELAREPIVFTTADGSHRCTVRSAQNIVVERLGVETRPENESNRESNRAREKET